MSSVHVLVKGACYLDSESPL